MKPVETRVVLEYFKPSLDQPGAFPLGLILQDDKAVLFRLIRPPRFHLQKFSEFALEHRELTMHDNILVEHPRGPSGEMLKPTSADFLQRLAEDGVGHFRYGPIWRVEGISVSEFAEALAASPGAAETDIVDQLIELENQVASSPALRELERQIG